MIKPWTSFICVCKTHRFRTCNANVAWQTHQPTPWPMPNEKSPLYPENRGNRVEFWNILMLQNYALNAPTQKNPPLGKVMLHGDGNDLPFPLWNPRSCSRKRVGVFTLTMPAVWFAQAPTTTDVLPVGSLPGGGEITMFLLTRLNVQIHYVTMFIFGGCTRLFNSSPWKITIL